MGRGIRSRKAQRRRKQEREQGTTAGDDRDKQPRKPYQDLVRENTEFDKYYKLQNICPDDEWGDFLKTLKSDLPTGFRITGSKSEAKVLLDIVKGQYFKDFLNAKKDEGETNVEPVCLPWYPDNLAWQLHLTRKDIRRNEVYFKLHNFLMAETASGSISRQEVVSMIPPIVLDILPHHKVLDMCAAPGSKTAQLIEYLHNTEDNKLPRGLVVANDIDNTRCYMLVHQAKRMNSPCIIVTNHDASVLPNFSVIGPDGGESMMKFDRILCDVPCTGDGTLRKNPDIWQKWNTANGTNLHGVQFRVVKRGCELLNIGGRLVYSTCSLNPLENEAVLHRLLLEADGALQLMDASNLLPGLKYNKGMTHWLPTSRDVIGFNNFEEVPEKLHTIIRPQMFPPSKEVADRLHLDRCIRILPHHQDTGAFFVAVLEKTKSLPWEAKKTVNSEVTEPVVVGPARKKRRMFGFREDPYVFFEDNDPLWLEIKAFYDISSDVEGSCFLVRCKEGKKKNIYFTSPQVRDIVKNNTDKFKIINTGVKTFVRCESKEMACSFRLAQEGLASIYPYIGEKRKVTVTKEDLILLLSNSNPKCPLETTKLSLDTQERIAAVGQGTCILIYNGEPCLQMVGWIGSMSTRPYVATCDVVHFLRLLGGDTSKFEVNKFQQKTNYEEESLEKDNEADDTNTEDLDDKNEDNGVPSVS